MCLTNSECSFDSRTYDIEVLCSLNIDLSDELIDFHLVSVLQLESKISHLFHMLSEPQLFFFPWPYCTRVFFLYISNTMGENMYTSAMYPVNASRPRL